MKVDQSAVNKLLERCPALHGYHLVRELGHGGMGAVYLLKDAVSSPVALKIMLHAEGADESARARFVREINNTTELRHPNVVRILQGGECERILYYTMEFCAGGSVASIMKRRGDRLPLPEAGGITLQVLDALEYAHQAPVHQVQLADGSLAEARGIVHRDLKPDNIFLAGADLSGPAKVADLGLSKAFELAGLTALTPDRMVAGTPHFQPRQQVLDFRHAGPEVDIWAAAASLYNMLTSCVPRNFTPLRNPFLTVLETVPVPVLKRDPKVPSAVATLLDEALDDTGDTLRFQSAAAFRAALTDALARSGAA